MWRLILPRNSGQNIPRVFVPIFPRRVLKIGSHLLQHKLMMDPNFKQKIQNSFEKICTSWRKRRKWKKSIKRETSLERKWTDTGEIQMYFDFLDSNILAFVTICIQPGYKCPIKPRVCFWFATKNSVKIVLT